MSTTSTQYSFSVTSVTIILVAPSRIKQQELSLNPNSFDVPEVLNVHVNENKNKIYFF